MGHFAAEVVAVGVLVVVVVAVARTDLVGEKVDEVENRRASKDSKFRHQCA